MHQREIAQRLSRSIDKSVKETNEELTLIRLGLNSLPATWEVPLLEITSCRSRENFRKNTGKFPSK